MGQKVNPKSMRMKINKIWSSRWFSDDQYADKLNQDIKIRSIIEEKLKDAAVSEVIINRDSNKVAIDIHSGRPGVVIGRGGAGTDLLKKHLAKFIKDKIHINIIEIKKPDADATIIAKNIASQIEKRIPFRRAIRQVMERAKTAGAKGIKIQISGRLNGAEIARSEKFNHGTVPLSTFKSDVDYRYQTALTTYGIIGIKVWVYNGVKLMNIDDYEK